MDIEEAQPKLRASAVAYAPPTASSVSPRRSSAALASRPSSRMRRPSSASPPPSWPKSLRSGRPVASTSKSTTDPLHRIYRRIVARPTNAGTMRAGRLT